MGMVHALNKGDIKPSDVSKSVRDVLKQLRNQISKISFYKTQQNSKKS